MVRSVRRSNASSALPIWRSHVRELLSPTAPLYHHQSWQASQSNLIGIFPIPDTLRARREERIGGAKVLVLGDGPARLVPG